MKSRALQSSKLFRPVLILAAAILLVAAAAAAVFFCHIGWFTVSNAETGEVYARYLVREGDWFSISFIHSVNNSPLTNYYEFHDSSVYVEKTVYYGFGAGVKTELEEGQTLQYGEDGSMIITGFHQEIPDLVYIVGTVSDHTLVVNGSDPVSLRDLCGRHTKVRFSFQPLL